MAKASDEKRIEMIGPAGQIALLPEKVAAYEARGYVKVESVKKAKPAPKADSAG